MSSLERKRHGSKISYSVLLDTGATDSLIGSNFVKVNGLPINNSKANPTMRWTTPNGAFFTNKKVRVPFFLNEFSTSKKSHGILIMWYKIYVMT